MGVNGAMLDTFEQRCWVTDQKVRGIKPQLNQAAPVKRVEQGTYISWLPKQAQKCKGKNFSATMTTSSFLHH